MRKPLTLVAVVLIAASPLRADLPDQITLDEKVLKSANLKTDGEALVEFFKRRVLSDDEREKMKGLVQKLGAEVYRVREQAAAELVARGPVVIELLREAARHPHLEIARRAERCLQRIQEKDVPEDVFAPAVRLLVSRKPAAALETLLGYLPSAENESVLDKEAVTEAIRAGLTRLGVQDGKADPKLLAALDDKLPLRRAAVAEALCRSGVAEYVQLTRKLLAESQPPFVRLRVGIALAYAKEPEAVPVLISLLPKLSQFEAWQAEHILVHLAEGNSPPTVSLGTDDTGRMKARDAWADWWQQHGKKVDFAQLQETPKTLGFTLVVLLDLGQVMELTVDNQPRWQIDGLNFPLDAQVLPGGQRVLVAEYHAGRVTERNLKGDILWEQRAAGPLVAQRLANGNTFIATDSNFHEYDRSHKETLNIAFPGGERIMKAMKLPNGEIVCLTNEARIVRMDATGKQLHSFNVALATRLFGGRIHMLPNGRVLVPHNAENKVIEYDLNGKAVWEVSVDQPVAATRLPNGHTLVTTMLANQGAVEFDRNGNVVWRFASNTRVTRAIRR